MFTMNGVVHASMRHVLQHVSTMVGKHMEYHHMASTMKAWQLYRFGQPDDLTLSTTAAVPPICDPCDILVQVHAASINPIDVRMMSGYGSQVLQMMRCIDKFPSESPPPEFPLILGRDFSGVVVNVGRGVKNIKPGDEVWGALGVQRQGTHCEYTTAAASSVSLKPKSLNHTEAASIPYAALTAWSALHTVGGLDERNSRRIRALIFGGSGGVGTFAIQLLHAWGARVTVVCSTDAIEFVKELGAVEVIDYKTQNVWKELEVIKGFDFILDAVGGDNPLYGLPLLKQWRNSKYVTIVPPFLSNTDRYGVVFGTALSFLQASIDTAYSLKDGRSMRWAFFSPNGKALRYIAKLADEGKIRPVIEKTFKFSECPDSYRKVLGGHARGKTVLEIAA